MNCQHESETRVATRLLAECGTLPPDAPLRQFEVLPSFVATKRFILHAYAIRGSKQSPKRSPIRDSNPEPLDARMGRLMI